MPLIGGSGGWAPPSALGGGGGGAILIAANTISFDTTATVYVAGGSPTGAPGGFPGSGGAIRLLANTITGPTSSHFDHTSAGGGTGLGRIRVEATVIDLPEVIPGPTITFDNDVGPIFPESDAPRLRIVTVNGEPFPADPQADIDTIDLPTEATMPVTLEIEANYVPVGTTVDVILKHENTLTTVTSSPLSGTLALSTATASITYADFWGTEVFLKANW